MFYSISPPYLLVFDDDRIRSIREQMMLLVDLVKRRARAGLVWNKDFTEFYLICFGINCNTLYR